MSLISSTERAYFTGAFSEFFDTFAEFTTITVCKEPVKTIVSIGSQPLFGYGGASDEDNFTYTPVSGNFTGLVDYPTQQNGGFIEEANQRLAHDEALIQVKQDARDYIMNGATEKLIIDGKTFKLSTEDRTESYLTHTWYSFRIKLAP